MGGLEQLSQCSSPLTTSPLMITKHEKVHHNMNAHFVLNFIRLLDNKKRSLKNGTRWKRIGKGSDRSSHYRFSSLDKGVESGEQLNWAEDFLLKHSRESDKLPRYCALHRMRMRQMLILLLSTSFTKALRMSFTHHSTLDQTRQGHDTSKDENSVLESKPAVFSRLSYLSRFSTWKVLNPRLTKGSASKHHHQVDLETFKKRKKASFSHSSLWLML